MQEIHQFQKINQIGFEKSKLDGNFKDKIKQQAEEFLRSLKYL